MKHFVRTLEILIIVGMFAATFYAYPWLPEQIPSHWGASGEVDDYMPKSYGIWLLPIITVVMALIIPLVRYIDPKKQNYKKFEVPFAVFQLTMVAYFAYIFAIQLYASLYPESSGNAAQLIISGAAVLFIVIGLLMPKIRWNFFVGVRTPWTLASERVWNRTHDMTGKLWIVAGVLTLIATLSGTLDPLYIFVPAIIVIAVIPIVYSYLIFPKAKKS